MCVEFAIDVVEDFARPHTIASGQHRLAIEGIAVDALDLLRSNKEWIFAIFDTISFGCLCARSSARRRANASVVSCVLFPLSGTYTCYDSSGFVVYDQGTYSVTRCP